MSINASKLVQIVPRVVDAGTAGLSFSGLFLTQSRLPPAGRVLQFASAQAVSDYFGSTSLEAELAAQYFKGYVNTAYLPARLFFASWSAAAVPAWLRGAEYEGTLAALQSVVSGSMSISIDNVEKTLTGLNFSGVNSFSEVAELIQNALVPESEQSGPVVTYSSQAGAFQITSPTTGSDSAVSYASGEVAVLLNLTEQSGAVQSVGMDAISLTDTMVNILNYARDWVSFSTVFEPEYDQKIELAKWCAGHDTRFVYVMWDTDNAAQVQGSTASAGYAINHELALDGICCVYNAAQLAAGVMGAIASLNFNQREGRTTLAYRQFEGMPVTCDNDEKYDTLLANGYNCYADFATASAQFKFFQNGQVSGKFDWLDTYLNAIAIKDALQLNILDLLAAMLSLPYNDDGYAAIRTACLDTINRFVNFGAIRSGVSLSNSQKVQLLAEIGHDVSQTLESLGWYMQITDPGAVTRGRRESPNCAFYYMDGGSIQKIVMSSTVIQ